MRNLFLSLILANLAFAAWTQWFAGDTAGVTMQGAGDGGSLTLVSEMTAPQSDPLKEPAEELDGGMTPPQSVTAMAETRCVSLGPFRERSEAATAAANLRSTGLRPTQRSAEGDIWVGYWVHLPDFASRAEAKAALSKLRANGVSDSYVVPGDDSGHTISLGVFSEIKRAGRRRDEVRRLGFDPQVVDRNRRGTVYWVDLTLEPGEQLSPEKLQSLPGRIIRLEQRSCDSVG